MRLPTNCTVQLPDERFADAAKALRSQPALVGEMRWHFAAIASYIDNLDNLDTIASRVLERIEKI